MRRFAVILLLTAVVAPIPSHATVTVDEVTFTVDNPLDPGVAYTVAGRLYRPDASCTASVMLLLHGLSYGK